MTIGFQANCLPTLIGSLPLADHKDAIELVFEHTPDIPIWVQLPVHEQEGMMRQFLPGTPGLCLEKDRVYIDSAGKNFQNDILEFYEDYMAAVAGKKALSDSRFRLTAETAGGFFVLLEKLKRDGARPIAVKGQITGPFTFCTGLSDQNDRAIFYDDQIRDVSVKLLALKARWQVQQLSAEGRPVIIFFDEPALAGFGSSEFISISREDVAACFKEVIEAVHAEKGLAGVHVCANTDWSLILESSVDIVNFDAYDYFDRFILYPDQIKYFLDSGRILAWGIVPTSNNEDIEKETVVSLVAAWQEKAAQLEALGIDRTTILAQSLITPSCGAGTLSLDLSRKVLMLTKNVSDRLRRRF